MGPTGLRRARLLLANLLAGVVTASPAAANSAEEALQETLVSLDVQDLPLEDALAEVARQTGNSLADAREKLGQPAPPKRVTLTVQNQPFWSVADQLLDVAQLSPYPFAENRELALVQREPGVLRRFGRATYVGPFRIEPTAVIAQRGLRVPEESRAQVDLEIMWEPRLQPLALIQRAADVKAVSDDGLELPITGGRMAFDMEATPGAQSAEASIPLQLPGRGSKSIASLRGKMTVLVPLRTADLKFADLASRGVAGTDGVEQIEGGVRVTLDRVAKVNEMWEVHMRVGLVDPPAEAARRTGWFAQNLCYMESATGEKIDHAGYETASQSPTEAGFLYLFELPGDIGDYHWIYRTPVDLRAAAIEYELKDLPLP